MADNERDLLEEEEEAEGGKKKKKAKKEKREKQPKEKREKAPKEKKKGSGILSFLIGVLFILIVDVVAIGIVYLDIGGFKEPINQLLNFNETALAAERSILADEQRRVNQQQTEVDNQRKKNEAEADALIVREKALSERETQVESELRSVAELRERLASQAAELDKTVGLLSKMDAVDAAAILQEIEDRDYVTQLFRNMEEKTQLEIIAELPVDMATDLLLRLSTG